MREDGKWAYGIGGGVKVVTIVYHGNLRRRACRVDLGEQHVYVSRRCHRYIVRFHPSQRKPKVYYLSVAYLRELTSKVLVYGGVSLGTRNCIGSSTIVGPVTFQFMK